MPTTYPPTEAEEFVIDTKMKDSEVMLTFISEAGPDYLTLLLLLVDPRGLPSRDESISDDKRVDDIEEARSNLISDFYQWASSTRRLEAWVNEYVAQQDREAAEDRAESSSWGTN